VKYVENELIHHDSSTIPDAVIGQIPTGIVPRFGFALVSFRVVDWEAGAGSAELAKALLEKETQAYRAEGVRQTAMGARDAKSLLAEGEGLRYGMLIKALTDKGVDPNVAAQVVREQVRTENVRDSKVTTYIEGGGSNASIMIPAIGSGSKEKETV
jgi:hypothetical protein